MSEVKITKEYFDIVKQISDLNSEILFVKENDKVVVRQKNEYQIVVVLETQVENFDFPAEELAVYNFRNLYSFYKDFKPESVELKDNKIVLKRGKAKINYILSERDIIEKSTFSKLNIDQDPVTSFSIGEDEFKEISKMISNVGAKSIKLRGNEKTILVKVFNEDEENDNSFEKEFVLDSQIENSFDLNIKPEFFQMVPPLPYLFRIYDRGDKGFLFNLNYSNDIFKLDLYVSKKLEN